MMESVDVLIIGAGISGLLCATELQRAGYSVRVIDKGRGVGGRMATRRMAHARFDHGAQYFTVRDKRFQAYVDEWLEAGIIREWFRTMPQDTNPAGYPRYRGLHGMTDVPKYLASSLDVHSGEQVVDLARSDGIWIAQTSSGRIYTGFQIVVTVPLPQAISLLSTSGLNWAGADLPALRDIQYEKGLATLVLLDGPSGIDQPGGLKIDDGPLSWIGDNQQKGISPASCAVTLHATSEFALEHWDSSDELRGPLMIEAAKNFLASDVVNYTCHRWGFTTPINHWHEPYFQNPGLKMILAGDAFGGPRVEGSALSGIQAGQCLAKSARPLPSAL
ncbi:MAG: FAD-dependent oxidoreductase [Verrucomicrobiota bacterium]